METKDKEIKGMSFEQWCIENDGEWLQYWDYDLNKLKPSEVSKSSNKKFYFKCSRGLHPSELTMINNITGKKHMQYKCRKCNSFGQWCMDNNREDILERWDYDLNNMNPFEISARSSKKYWFKCPRGLHRSQLFSPMYLRVDSLWLCHECESIGQYLLDTYGDKGIDMYWSDKNDISPFAVRKSAKTKVWFKCQNVDYHEDYLLDTNAFHRGNRCPYCASTKVHPNDSFAQWGINNFGEDFLEKYWNYDKNIKDPWNITPGHNGKAWFKCQKKDYHDSYDIKVSDFTKGSRCPYCSGSRINIFDSVGYLYPIVFEYFSPNNDLTPYEIFPHSDKKYKFICPIHGEYEKSMADFVKSKNKCPMCFDPLVIGDINATRFDISFEEWCKNNNRQDLLDRWDYELNDKLPSEVGYSSGRLYFFKCPRNIHESQQYALNNVTSTYRKHSKCECEKCESFGQYLIDEFGDDAISKYWSDKNIVNPFSIRKSSKTKVWIKCQKNNDHEDYIITTGNFRWGNRCPMCDKESTCSSLEEKTYEYIDFLGYDYLTEDDCTINPVNYKTGKILPFDIEIPLLKLIIEVHGSQHYEITGFTIMTANHRSITPEEQFEYERWKDRFKKNYAISNGYEYLEIPYTAFKNDDYKKIINDKINQIICQQRLIRENSIAA